MPVLPVVSLPHAALQQPAAEVGSVDAAVLQLLDDLVETMRASPHCVGLAANQVGVGRRVAVVDITGHKKAKSQHGLIELVDPEVVEAGPLDMAREGCMSVPDLTGDVHRASWVVVRALSRDGAPFTLRADAFEARALQHEIDHLDGRVFLDRVASHAAVFRRRVYR